MPVEVRVPYPVHVPVDQIVHVPHEVERVVYRDVPIETTVLLRDQAVPAPVVKTPNLNVGLGLGVGLGKFPLLKKFKKIL